MFQVTNEFTRDELEALADATGTWVSAYEGPAPDVAQMQALHEKINRLLLLGQRVRFTHEGEELTGTLDRLETALDGSERAVVIRKGFGYLVSPDDVLGPVE